MTTAKAPSEAQPATVTVHPRMRSRRIAVLRHAGRRRLRRAVYVAVAVAAAVAAYAVTRSSLLDVDHVRVRGGRHTDPDAVALASGIGRGDPMLWVDLSAAARRVEALPWVADARVERHWLGTVRIAVTERTPVATVRVRGGGAAVVDADGRVLAVGDGASAVLADAAPDGLPRLAGAGGRLAVGDSLDGRTAGDVLMVAAALVDRLPGTATEVSTDLVATLAIGGQVRFGTTDDLDDKIVAVATVLSDVDLSCLGTLDVRVPASPVLTRDEGCP